jgi:creatinine amidohydrolase
MTRLAELTWVEVADRAAASLLVVPLGSTEQHGPHLPLSTDTDIALALAGRLAATRQDVLVAPAVAYGSSGEHADFAGTLSIGRAATATVLVELVRSADAFRGVVIVSAHGGNAGPLRRATGALANEGRRILVWSPRMEGADAHAGFAETSMLLALGIDVRDDLVVAGNTSPLAELARDLRTKGVAALSANGILGDPTGANPADGKRLLRSLADDLVASVAAVFPA